MPIPRVVRLFISFLIALRSPTTMEISPWWPKAGKKRAGLFSIPSERKKLIAEALQGVGFHTVMFSPSFIIPKTVNYQFSIYGYWEEDYSAHYGKRLPS